MANVSGWHAEPELQGSGGVQEIFESNGDALSGLVTLDSSSNSSRLDGNRIDRDISYQLIDDESLATKTALLIPGSLDSMNQLHNGHN